MRLPFRSRTNRRRAWWDRLGEKIFGSQRRPLTAAEVKHRAIAVVALMLPYVTWNHGQAVVRHAKEFRGRMDAQIAEGMRLDGRGDAALSRLMHAQERTPQLPEIWRAIGWAAAPAFPVQATYYFAKLAEEGKLSPEDGLMLASLHLRLNQPENAAAVYETLVQAHPSNPDIWRAWGSACHLRGDYSEALKAYRRVCTLSPHDLVANVGKADLLQRTRTPQSEKEAADLLLAQLKRAVGAGLPCANDLAHLVLALPLNDTQQRSEVAGLLKRVEGGGAELELAALFLSHPVGLGQEQAESRREQVRTFLASHRRLDYAERKKVSLWLKQHDENALLLEWMSLADAAGDEVLFALRLEALFSSGQWREAAEMALHPAAGPLSEKPQWLQTLVALRSGREAPAMAEMLLRQAMGAAADSGNATACTALGFASLDYGAFPLAAEAFGAVMKGGEGANSLLTEYLHAARRSGGSAGQVLASIEHAQMGKSNEDMQKQLIYLRLLCGDEIERAALDLARLKKESPEDPYVKFLNAFIGYRLGDYASAVRSLLPLPAHRWQQGETVVIATILASGGQVREAAKLVSKVTGQGVFPEERKMLEGWQSRAELDANLLSSVTVMP